MAVGIVLYSMLLNQSAAFSTPSPHPFLIISDEAQEYPLNMKRRSSSFPTLRYGSWGKRNCTVRPINATRFHMCGNIGSVQSHLRSGYPPVCIRDHSQTEHGQTPISVRLFAMAHLLHDPFQYISICFSISFFKCDNHSGSLNSSRFVAHLSIRD
jgi:hypothetical protein